MKKVITTISTVSRLFRQPRKIGDTFEHNDKTYMVIGIERFEVLYNTKLKVWYTCQNLSETDYVTRKKAYQEPFQLEAEVKLKYDDERIRTRAQLGTVHFMEGEFYKIMEYTDIELNGTDLLLSFIVKPLYPVDRKEAKAKLLDSRKRKLQLEVF
ncbi:hypothetical protein [Bacillus badius]|nr:hypothetical protein [Bacillus badius]MED4718633.1 hypothetical protein [Bacillus badius]